MKISVRKIVNGARKFNVGQAAKIIKNTKKSLHLILGKKRKNVVEKITSSLLNSVQPVLFPPQGSILLPPLGKDSHRQHF